VNVFVQRREIRSPFLLGEIGECSSRGMTLILKIGFWGITRGRSGFLCFEIRVKNLDILEFEIKIVKSKNRGIEKCKTRKTSKIALYRKGTEQTKNRESPSGRLNEPAKVTRLHSTLINKCSHQA
jgi:hypothetical protein